MKDLWQASGILIANGIPPSIWAVAKAGANTKLVEGKAVVVGGVHDMQTALEDAIPGLTCSLFAAGEIIRWLSVEDPDDIEYVKLAAPVELPENPSFAFYECLGLLLFDNEFLANITQDPPAWRGYRNTLRDDEKAAILYYVQNNPVAIGKQATNFRKKDWESGSCEVAYCFYAGYVHNP
jgi:hypothetical protein